MTKLFATPEGASPITEEQKEGLRQKWVSTQEELNQIEQNNILLAQTWLFNARQKKADYASIEFLIKLHTRMLNDVYSWAGTIRTTDTNIGVEPYTIRTEVANLQQKLEAYIRYESYPKDEIAIRYHHHLVAIHCFTNGNGRHSRLMADYINEQVFGNPPFTWGKKQDLYTTGTARSTYLNAIYQANDHNYQPLVHFAKN